MVLFPCVLQYGKHRKGVTPGAIEGGVFRFKQRNLLVITTPAKWLPIIIDPCAAYSFAVITAIELQVRLGALSVAKPDAFLDISTIHTGKLDESTHFSLPASHAAVILPGDPQPSIKFRPEQ